MGRDGAKLGATCRLHKPFGLPQLMTAISVCFGERTASLQPDNQKKSRNPVDRRTAPNRRSRHGGPVPSLWSALCAKGI
jgi:hypothetical protein